VVVVQRPVRMEDEQGDRNNADNQSKVFAANVTAYSKRFKHDARLLLVVMEAHEALPKALSSATNPPLQKISIWVMMILSSPTLRQLVEMRVVKP
jgi:hypothetical protein